MRDRLNRIELLAGLILSWLLAAARGAVNIKELRTSDRLRV